MEVVYVEEVKEELGVEEIVGFQVEFVVGWW